MNLLNKAAMFLIDLPPKTLSTRYEPKIESIATFHTSLCYNSINYVPGRLFSYNLTDELPNTVVFTIIDERYISFSDPDLDDSFDVSVPLPLKGKKVVVKIASITRLKPLPILLD